MSRAVTSSSGTVSAADGASIAYTLHTAAGSEARPRIALIHSLALDRSFWDGVMPLLTPHADVLTYDCRGHGKSAKVRMTYTAELFAGDLASLLDHVKWPRAIVAGCSMGGCIAQAFAGAYPDRARGLVVMDSTASGTVAIPSLRFIHCPAIIARIGLPINPFMRCCRYAQHQPESGDSHETCGRR